MRSTSSKRAQQRDAVIAEFNAGNTQATLQAMATAVLNYRQVVNQLLCVVKLGPGTYYLQATSPATYFDRIGIFNFADEKVVYLERAAPETVDAPTASQ